MNEYRSVLERAGSNFPPLELEHDSIVRRRDRKRRNQRIAAGVVGIAVFVAALWIVTSVASLDRSETSVVPGGDVTGPAETGPTETGPAEIIGPVPEADYLVDLETGASTPLPESIGGKYDVTGDYAVSPDGSRLAYVRRGEKGMSAIFVANLDGTGVEQVTSGGTREPAWSPDGSRIAYVGHHAVAPTNVFVLDLETGVSTQVTDEPDRAWTYAPSFTPDGESIVYGASRYDSGEEVRMEEVRIVPTTGGRSLRLVGGDGMSASSPALSPDGALLSYSCGDEYISDLCLANADGTDARVLVAGTEYSAPSWSPDGTRIAYGVSSVYVVDVGTGKVTTVGEGAFPTWLDGHTLIVEIDICNRLHGCGF